MNVPRTLIPLRQLPVIAARYSSTANAPSSSGSLELFRQINKFASEGKWDSINNAPKLFLFGKDKANVYRVYHQMISPNANIFGRSPYGQYMKVLWRVFLLFGGTWALYTVYELIVPEEYRLQYKYRAKHEHEHAEH